MRRNDLRQIFLRSRNTLIKYSMQMAMDLSSFCLDNDRVEGLLLNKKNVIYIWGYLREYLGQYGLIQDTSKRLKNMTLVV